MTARSVTMGHYKAVVVFDWPGASGYQDCFANVDAPYKKHYKMRLPVTLGILGSDQ